MKIQEEEEARERFRKRAEQAEAGWLPPVEERLEINSDVLVKALGIDPERTWPDAMSTDQRLTLIAHWFAGTEAEIPYEEWGLRRPPWIPSA